MTVYIGNVGGLYWNNSKASLLVELTRQDSLRVFLNLCSTIGALSGIKVVRLRGIFLKLLLSILLAGLLGILVILGPIGIYILCAIIVGVIFRSFILINEVHKQVVPPNSNDKVKEAYERYIKERDEEEKETEN